MITNKNRIIFGFLISVFFIIVTFYFIKFSSLFPPLERWIYITNYIPGSIFIVFALVFTILNTLAIVLCRNNEELKKGIKYGYLLLFLFILYPIAMNYVNQKKIMGDTKSFSQAVENDNYELCANISIDYKRNDCYASFINTKAANTDLCQKFTDISYRNSCVNKAASDNSLKTGTGESCKSLSSEYDRNGCLSNAAASLNNISICYDIDDKTAQDNCISWVVSHQSDTSLYMKYCPIIKDTTNKLNCYYSWAYEARDPSICKRSGVSYYENYSLNGIRPCLEKRP